MSEFIFVTIVLGAIFLAFIMLWSFREELYHVSFIIFLGLILIFAFVEKHIDESNIKTNSPKDSNNLNIINHGVLNLTVNESNIPQKVECIIVDGTYYCEQK